jgi:hypothetical protein
MNMKVIGGLLAVILVVIAIGVSVVVQNVDGIVKGLIEEIGSEITGTKVTVGEVAISLTEGSGTIKGLKVNNPEGFSKANIFEIDQISLDIDPTSLAGSVYVIDEVLIDGARVLAEQTATSSNVEAIMANVEKASSSTGDTTGSDDGASSEASADIQLAVSKFSFVNSSAKLITTEFGEHALDIPNIRLTNLGNAENGLTPDELAAEVVSSMTREIKKAVQNKINSLIEDGAKKAAEAAIEAKLSVEDKEKVGLFKKLFKKK